MSEPGSYDELDLSEFSQEDFDRLDVAIAQTYAEEQQITSLKGWLKESNGGPALQVELEDSSDHATPSFSVSQVPAPDSPYVRHRSWRNALTVTDLTSPQWCELQFDYGLRQMRHLRLEQRPKVFKSASGNEIKVQAAVAADNDRTLRKGKSVHKVLEKEIRPEEIRVDVTTNEERWALRLINMLSCLECLQSLPCAREMPVFGLLDAQVVVGIIDEVALKPIDSPVDSSPSKPHDASTPGTPRKAKKVKQPKAPPTPKGPVQASLTQFFPISPSKEKEIVEQEDTASSPSRTMPAPAHTALEPTPPAAVPITPRSILHLSDTKTRRTPTLPPDEDTVTSRLQLMLYHRLLSALLRDFDFPLFWEAAGVDPARPLPERFVNQSRPMLLSTRLPMGEGVDAQPTCLNSLAVLWQESVRQLGADTIHPSMALVYRTQVGTKRKRESVRDTAEAADLQVAIQASLQDANLTADTALAVATAPAVPSELSGSSNAPAAADDTDPASVLLREDPELAWALQQSLLTASQEARAVTASNVQDTGVTSSNAAEPGSALTNGHEDDAVPEVSRILGRKEFAMDDTFLNRHLSSILAYWYGRRKPLGVSVEVSRRCFTCEYCEGCEWRAAKAEEATARYRQRHGTDAPIASPI